MKLGQLEEFLASTVSGKDVSIQREAFLFTQEWNGPFFYQRRVKYVQGCQLHWNIIM